jgi:hypothetical protein
MKRVAIVGVVGVVAMLCAPAARAGTVHSDFNGDGFADLAIGITGQTVSGRTDAGAVSIVYGSATGLSATASLPDQLWHRDVAGIVGSAKTSARFGSVLAIGNFNGDDFDDLAIGVPSDRVSGFADAGSLTVLLGSANGLTAAGNQMFSQDSSGVSDSPQTGEHFAAALAAGDFNDDGRDDLAVGVPAENLVTETEGAIHVLFGTAGGLSSTAGPGKHFLTQNTPDIRESAGDRDNFGEAVATGDFNDDGVADLAVGAPGESFGDEPEIGLVHVIYGSATAGLSAAGNELIQQGRNDYEGDPDASDSFGRALVSGDFNGDGVADLGIGTDDDAVAAFNAGALAVVYGASPGGVNATNGPGDQLISQESSSIPGSPVNNGTFSEQLAVGDFNADTIDDIAIGSRNETVGTATAAGTATIVYGADPGGLAGANAPGALLVSQDLTGMNDTAEAGDHFGLSLAAGDFDGDGSDDFAAGVTGEDDVAVSDAGAVHAVYGDPTAGIDPTNSPSDQLFGQSTTDFEGDAEASDFFGTALATGLH